MFGPNITGGFSVRTGANATDLFGAFYEGEAETYTRTGGDTGTTYVNTFGADRSDSIYSKSLTVQPASNQALIIIKT